MRTRARRGHSVRIVHVARLLPRGNVKITLSPEPTPPGGTMSPSSEQDLSEVETSTPVADGNGPSGVVDTKPTGPITGHETPTSAVARMLELAGVTAERLVTDAETEAESLVGAAQARADAILEASRNEANRVAAELARTKEEQTVALDRERATALAELADEKASLEAQVVTLRQHRSQMRQLLTEQLSMLDAPLPESPAG